MELVGGARTQKPVSLADLKAWLLRHGLVPADIRRDTGVRIVTQQASMNDATADQGVFIEVVRYVRNENGSKFVDSATGAAAQETMLIPLLGFPE